MHRRFAHLLRLCLRIRTGDTECLKGHELALVEASPDDGFLPCSDPGVSQYDSHHSRGDGHVRNSPGVPTGSVAFLVGGGSYSCTLAAAIGHSASCSPTVSPNVSTGTYSVRASYSGDANFMSSSSSGALSIAGPGVTAGTGGGTGSVTEPTPPPKFGGTPSTSPNPIPGLAGVSPNTVSLASIESSAQTYEDDVSVAEQTAAAQKAEVEWAAYLKHLAVLRAHNGVGDPSNGGTGTTNSIHDPSDSLQGAATAKGLNGQAQASAKTASGGSENQANTNLVVSESGRSFRS